VEVKIMNPISDYLSELKLLGRSSAYIKSTGYAMDKFQKSCNGKGILKVNEDTIKTFIHDMRDQQLADRTLTDYVRAIDRFYSYVVDTQKYGLTFNPVKRLSKRLNHKRQQTKRPIKTLDEIAKLIKGIYNPRDRAIIVLLAKTAIRNGELVALNIEDIDFDNETLTVNKHIGDHETNTIVKGRKNGNESLIPLDDETIRALKFYLMSRPKTRNKALFISHTGNRLYAQDIIRIVREWSIKTKISIETTDIDKKIVPHFFRAWATYTLQINGCNPAVIDAIRGDVASTIRAFYVNQVLPFEVIRKEYLKAVAKFGI
jgi:site-specific recombinase XerD